MGRGTYDRQWRRMGENVNYVEEEIHVCPTSPRPKSTPGNLQVYVFKGFDIADWSMKIDREFVEIKFCPFCGEELK